MPINVLGSTIKIPLIIISLSHYFLNHFFGYREKLFRFAIAFSISCVP